MEVTSVILITYTRVLRLTLPEPRILQALTWINAEINELIEIYDPGNCFPGFDMSEAAG